MSISLFSLSRDLKCASSLEEKVAILTASPLVLEGACPPPYVETLLEQYLYFSLVAIKQTHLFPLEDTSFAKECFEKLAKIDAFYAPLGGLVGYHFSFLEHLQEREQGGSKTFKAPACIDISELQGQVRSEMLSGIEALDQLAEVYTVGGLGERLNLRTAKGEPLPAAALPFHGRSLLEGLVRDVEGREFLFYKLYGKQVRVPIALMTSEEKGNHEKIEAMCQKNHFFGRGSDAFFLFSQLSVPVVTEEGTWISKAPLSLQLQPGGHGALWQTALQKGVFKWFSEKGKTHLLIRQINNPVPGLDHTLFTLVGIGKEQGKAFGFAGCPRLPDMAEGALVELSQGERRSLSNIEYTEFEKCGLEKVTGAYPANTNLLYADLDRMIDLVDQHPLPGLMVNLKGRVAKRLPNGETTHVAAGRLESMMQSLSDALVAEDKEPLPSFVTLNARHKTLAATKRSGDKRDSETPESAFYSYLQSVQELLEDHCKMKMPPLVSKESYFEKGPDSLFLYHPALGPLFEVIAQKIKRGELAPGSHLELEIAEVCLEDLELSGSLKIHAKQLLGHMEEGRIIYSPKVGRCSLKNCSVRNKGATLSSSEGWKNALHHEERLEIILEGESEFFAEDVLFEGSERFVVPDQERWTLLKDGNIVKELIEEPSWEWHYSLQNQKVHLHEAVLSFA